MSANQHGAMAIFVSPEEIKTAAKAAQSGGFKKFETFTPFPIHGMEDIMELPPSKVPWATLICGLTGFSLAVTLQIWTSAVDWPINIGGKPFISFPAFIPIMFELTVLLGGLGTAFFMFFLNGLPNMKKPMDPRLSDDRFALYIPFAEQSVSEAEVESFLNGLNAERVSRVTV